MFGVTESDHLLTPHNRHVTYHIDVQPSISDTLYNNNKTMGAPHHHGSTSYTELIGLLKLALPVTVSYALEIFPLFITTGFIGRLDNTMYMSVNSLSNIVFSVVCLSVLYGSTSALDHYATIAYGERDYVELRKWLYTAIICTTLCCSLLAIPVYFYIYDILILLGQDVNIVQLTVPYVRILLISVFPLVVFDSFKRWLQAQHQLLPILSTTIVCNLISIVLNYMLLFTDFWSITGINKHELVLNGAIAVTLSNICLCVILCIITAIMQCRDRSHLHELMIQGRQCSNIDSVVETNHISIMTYCNNYIQLAIPSIMQSMIEFITFDTLGLFAGILPSPEINLSAHAILFQTSVCSLILYYGIATSTTIKVGNAVGEYDDNKASRLASLGLRLGMCISMICGTILYCTRNYIGRLYTNNTDVIELVSHTTICLSFYQLFDCISNINHGLFRITAMQKFSALFTIIGFGCVGVPAAYVSGIHYQYGLYGIWCSVSIGIMLIAFMSLLVYRHINWYDVVQQQYETIDEQNIIQQSK